MLLNAVDNPRSSSYLSYLQQLISCAVFTDLKTFFIWLLTYHAHLIFCLYLFGSPISVSSAIFSSCPQPPNLRMFLNLVFEKSSSLLFYICTHPSVISSSLMYLFLILKMYYYSWEFSVDFKFEFPTISFSSSLWCLIDISNLTFLLSTILFPSVHKNLLSFSLPISVTRNSIHIILGLKPVFLYTPIQSNWPYLQNISKAEYFYHLYCNLIDIKDISVRRKFERFGVIFILTFWKYPSIIFWLSLCLLRSQL